VKPGLEQGDSRLLKEQIAPVSAIGGYILILALLLLIGAWAWQENAQSLDSAVNAGRFWKLGVLIAVFGAMMVAFAQVRK
jgi:hypothetical protein